jgi:hypothetical protein
MKITRLKVRFARPVLPGQVLTFQGYKAGEEDGGTKYGIIARSNEGKDVLFDAVCLVK